MWYIFFFLLLVNWTTADFMTFGLTKEGRIVSGSAGPCDDLLSCYNHLQKIYVYPETDYLVFAIGQYPCVPLENNTIIDYPAIIYGINETRNIVMPTANYCYTLGKCIDYGCHILNTYNSTIWFLVKPVL